MLLRSGCKINLGLTITGRRADGYHELDSLFVPLPFPADTLVLTPLDSDGCRVRCSRGDIDPERNTLTRAYAAFCSLGGRPRHGLDIQLTKRVPSGAGLGGGSANAAELLRGKELQVPREDLMPLKEGQHYIFDIIGMTTDERSYRKLALSWGVLPALSEEYHSVDVLFHFAKQAAKDSGLVKPGDVIVITGGTPNGKSGNSNLINIETV